MKTFKNWCSWIFLNGFFAAALWVVGFGPLKENAGCVNIFKFIVWFWALVQWPACLILLIASMAAKRKEEGSAIANQNQRVPRTLCIAYDVCFTMALAYLGWVWLAAAYFLHIVAQGFLLVIAESIRQIEAGERPAKGFK